MPLRPAACCLRYASRADERALLQLGGGRLGTARGRRKRWQIESFWAVLSVLADNAAAAESSSHKSLRIVDFGAGSGNFSLALAALLPAHSFTLVDLNAHAMELAGRRAREAGLTNVETRTERIEDFDADFDVAIALHACGNASDYAMAQAVRFGAAYVMAPCCVGKLKRQSAALHKPTAAEVLAGGDGDGAGAGAAAPVGAARFALSHPRSAAVKALLSYDEFMELAAFADHANEPPPQDPAAAALPAKLAAKGAAAPAASGGTAQQRAEATRTAAGRRQAEAARAASRVGSIEANVSKQLVEHDRTRWAAEQGWTTLQGTMDPPSASGKRDVLVGLSPSLAHLGPRLRERAAAVGAAGLMTAAEEEAAINPPAPPHSAGGGGGGSGGESLVLPSADAASAEATSSSAAAAAVEPSCSHFIERKQRSCKLPALNGSEFCANHQPAEVLLRPII